MKFLIIPEDFRKDQYILRPLMRELLLLIGFSNPKVEVCTDPLIGGVSEALKKDRLAEVFSRYEGMIDTFILCIDRDAEPNRHKALHSLEVHFTGHARLITVQAWEELETWVLAGLLPSPPWKWREVREARNVKEQFFDPLARELNLLSEPGGGRRTLGNRAATNIQRIRQLCKEDFDLFAQRLAELRT